MCRVAAAADPPRCATAVYDNVSMFTALIVALARAPRLAVERRHTCRFCP